MEKITDITAAKKRDGSINKKPAVGSSETDFNRAGNPVRIIWYGNPKDNDSKIAQPGALNNGFIHGKVNVEATRTTSKSEKGSTIDANGMANAIDALGWTPHTNLNSVEYSLTDGIVNNGIAEGEAKLQGGLGGVHGKVQSFATANGISLAAITDFGKDSIGGASGASGSKSSGSAAINNNNDDELDDDDLDDLLIDDGSTPRPPKDTSQTDMYGKNLNVRIAKVENTGTLSGSLNAQAFQGIKNRQPNKFVPMFYGVTPVASGNGMSLATYVDTPDRYTFSQEKENTLYMGSLKNSGDISGEAEVRGGANVTHTYTKTKAVGNGVSLMADSGRNAKRGTTVTLGAVENSGRISGSLKQVSGNTSSNNSVFIQGTAEALSSGNGISVLAYAENAQIPKIYASLGEANGNTITGLNNTGRISGEAHIRAGDGAGDRSINIAATGNGVSLHNNRKVSGPVSWSGWGQKPLATQLRLYGVNNMGMITGNLEAQPGVLYNAAKRGTAIPDMPVVPLLTDKDNVQLTDKGNTTPAKPDNAQNSGYGGILNSNNHRAGLDVRGSGSGISIFSSNGHILDLEARKPDELPQQLGTVYNQGVVSGYAKIYHGYENDSGYSNGYNVVGAGTGIFTDTKLSHSITNTGVISGSHAAILTPGGKNDAYSYRNPLPVHTYGTDKLKNYGLMASTLIAGVYRSEGGNSQTPTYGYFDSSLVTQYNQKDPLENLGTKVYLNRGYDYQEIEVADPWLVSGKHKKLVPVRNGKEELIERVEVGTGGKVSIPADGHTKEFDIINGAVDAAALANHQDTRSEVLDNNARLLPRGTVYTSVSGRATQNNALNGIADHARDTTLGAGVSYGVTDSFTVGAAVSGSREKLDGELNSKLKGNAVFGSVFAVKGFGDFTLTGGAAYGRSSLKGSRNISNGYDSGSYDARIKPSVASVFAEGKYAFRLNDAISYEPKVMLAYNRVRTDSVSENGVGGLQVSGRSFNTVDAGIGQDLRFTHQLPAGKLSAKVSLDYIHTSGQKDLTARFNGAQNGFAIRTAKNKSTVRAGVGAEYESVGGLVLRAGLADSIRKSRSDWQANFGVGLKF